jgi:DNA-binding response OmpR family regulator
MSAERGRAGEGAPFCPHCGYDLTADAPITIGDAHFDPRRGFFWRGGNVHLGPTRSIIVGSLMKAVGRWVAVETLAERTGYEGDQPGVLIRTQVCKLRAILREHGVPNLIDSRIGPNSLGYRWNDGPLVPAQVQEAA